MRQIDIAIAQRDAGGASATERFLDLEATVTVGVPQRDGPASCLWLSAPATGHERHVEIAVRRHCHVARRADRTAC